MSLTVDDLIRVKLAEAGLRMQLILEAFEAGKELDVAKHAIELAKVMNMVAELRRGR